MPAHTAAVCATARHNGRVQHTLRALDSLLGCRHRLRRTTQKGDTHALATSAVHRNTRVRGARAPPTLVTRAGASRRSFEAAGARRVSDPSASQAAGTRSSEGWNARLNLGHVVVAARAASAALELRRNALQVLQAVRAQLVEDAGQHVLQLCTRKERVSHKHESDALRGGAAGAGARASASPEGEAAACSGHALLVWLGPLMT